MKGIFLLKSVARRRRLMWPRIRQLAISAIGFSVLILALTKALTALIDGAVADARTDDTLAQIDPLVKRGEYLVSHVAKCGQCHRDPTQIDSQPNGTELVSVSIPNPGGSFAPSMSGLGGWDEADVVELLKTGHTRDGFEPRPPMPRYRFSDDDALAVARYLKSLP